MFRQITVLVVGLDNSGKTVTSKALVGGNYNYAILTHQQCRV